MLSPAEKKKCPTCCSRAQGYVGRRYVECFANIASSNQSWLSSSLLYRPPSLKMGLYNTRCLMPHTKVPIRITFNKDLSSCTLILLGRWPYDSMDINHNCVMFCTRSTKQSSLCQITQVCLSSKTTFWSKMSVWCQPEPTSLCKCVAMQTLICVYFIPWLVSKSVVKRGDGNCAISHNPVTFIPTGHEIKTRTHTYWEIA